MIAGIIIFVLSSLLVAISVATSNLLRKLELYEETIQEFYSALSITLHTMRVIDQKQMFEQDDEVGEVFEQLTTIINDLRPLLYGTADDRTDSDSSKT